MGVLIMTQEMLQLSLNFVVAGPKEQGGAISRF